MDDWAHQFAHATNAFLALSAMDKGVGDHRRALSAARVLIDACLADRNPGEVNDSIFCDIQTPPLGRGQSL